MTVVICVALLALGVWMLSGREITLLMPNQIAARRRLGSGYYGIYSGR